MRKIKVSTMGLAFGCVALLGQSAAVPVNTRASRLEPVVAKPGVVLTITGVGLDKTRVDEVYLTDHRLDMKVKVLEQTEQTLKIRVPPFAKPGRQQLLLLIGGPKAAYLEMPLYVTIEADEEMAAAVAQPVR